MKLNIWEMTAFRGSFHVFFFNDVESVNDFAPTTTSYAYIRPRKKHPFVKNSKMSNARRF